VFNGVVYGFLCGFVVRLDGFKFFVDYVVDLYEVVKV